jgi:hypothetical protein
VVERPPRPTRARFAVKAPCTTATARLRAPGVVGIVSREHWTPDMQVGAERVGVHPHGDDAGGVVRRWLAADHDNACGPHP